MRARCRPSPGFSLWSARPPVPLILLKRWRRTAGQGLKESVPRKHNDNARKDNVAPNVLRPESQTETNVRVERFCVPDQKFANNWTWQ